MSAIEPSNQSQATTSQGEVKVESNIDHTQLLNQPQAPLSRAEVKDVTKSDGTQSSTQSQAVISQPKVKVEVMTVKDSSYKVKPPLDLFPWIYWLPFILIVIIVPIIMAHKSVPQVSLPVLHHGESAYHVITQSDVYMKSFDQSTVTTDTVRKGDDLIGHYTLAIIHSDRPINLSQIGPKPDQSLIMDTLAVAIPANNAMVLGGNLRAGVVVSLASLPTSNNNSIPIMVFDKVLVLDVKSVGGQTVIVLAIPANRWLDYLAKTRNATVVLARQVK